MTGWHVTPAARVESILAAGLLVDPPQRTFQTGRAVYLADTPDAARRWATEIARELGARTPMALLEVDVTGLAFVRVAATEVGVAQLVVRTDIAPARIRVAETFTADPAPNPARSGGGDLAVPAPAEVECSAGGCGSTFGSPEGAAAHLAECHDPDEVAQDAVPLELAEGSGDRCPRSGGCRADPRGPGTVPQMNPTVAVTLQRLRDDFGLGRSDLAEATGARERQLRALGRGEADALDAVDAGRLAELLRVLEAAQAELGAAGAEVDECVLSGRLIDRIDVALAPRLLDVFADGRSDLVIAALTGRLTGVALLDAWRPGWRETLSVVRYEVVVDGDGCSSLAQRSPEAVRADRARLNLRG